MTPSLFDEPVRPAPSLFPESPAAPEPYVVKRVGSSWSVLDNAGMLMGAYASNREGLARQLCQDLNDAFRRGWNARDAVSAPTTTPGA